MEKLTSNHAAIVLSIRARLQRSATRLQSIADKKAINKTEKKKISASKKFEKSPEWRELSKKTRMLHPWCVSCSSIKELHADHIKPKSKFPELALDPKKFTGFMQELQLQKKQQNDGFVCMTRARTTGSVLPRLWQNRAIRTIPGGNPCQQDARQTTAQNTAPM